MSNKLQYVNVFVSSALQGIDVVMTLSAGGLAAEANPYAVAIWTVFGLYLILLLKLFTVFIFIMAWWAFGKLDKQSWQRAARTLLCVEFYGMMGLVTILNYGVIK